MLGHDKFSVPRYVVDCAREQCGKPVRQTGQRYLGQQGAIIDLLGLSYGFDVSLLLCDPLVNLWVSRQSMKGVNRDA